MEDILIGVTDRTILVFVSDPASTDGSGKTGLVAANLTVSYSRVETDNDVTVTDVTSSLNDLASLTAAHNDWGLFEVSNTLAPGLYRLDLADAVFASGAWYAVVYVMITTSAAAAAPKAFRLIARNDLDGVRLGLTALPNAAAEAAGGLYTRGTGAGQINQAANGQADANLVTWKGTAPLDLSSQQVQAVVPNTQKVDVETIKTNAVVNGGTVTFPSNATLASTSNITAGIITTVTNLTNAPSAGDFTATMKTSLNQATPSVTVSDKTGFSLSSAGLDAVTVETGLNLRQATSLIASALAGVLSGGATSTITIKGAGVATTRITATVDADGNRSALTLNPPA